ncbi:hypothetical protein Hanom_Chr07g00652511 [Helianthus anomalus]
MNYKNRTTNNTQRINNKSSKHENLQQIPDLNDRNLRSSFFKLFLRIFSFISTHTFLKLLR